MEIIVGRRGEQGFAITDKGVSGKHLKLTTLADGKVQVEDLGSSNGTFIDGVRIIKKIVSANSIVQMGSSYTFRISDALPAVKQASKPQQPTQQASQQQQYSIAHLEKVWNRYEQEVDNLDNQNKSINLMRSITPIFTMTSGVVASVSGGTLQPLCWGLTILGLIVTLYAFIRAKNFDYKREKNVIQEHFESEYVCPNPQCRHFMGNIKYKLLSQNKNWAQAKFPVHLAYSDIF